MRAVDAIMESLKAEGVEAVFGIPGWREPPHLRRALRRRPAPRPLPPRAGRGSRGGGLRQGVGARRRRARHLRARRYQPRDSDRRRDHGLGPDRLHHRAGPHRADRHRRVPGGRHDRHHPADRQALDGDPGPAADPQGHPRGLPHRAHRTAGPGPRRHPAGPLARGHPVRARRRRLASGLQAHDRGERQADPPGGKGARERAPTRDLRGRGRRERERGEGADRPLHVGPLPGDVHRHGARRVPGAARPVARDARDARDALGELRDGRGRPDLRGRRPFRRPNHRQALRVRAARKVHPHRHRSGGDLEERPGAHPDRGRREADPPEAEPRVPRARDRLRRGSTAGGSGSAAGARSTRSATRTRPTPRSSPST